MTPTYPGTGQPMTAGVLADGSTVNHLDEHGNTLGFAVNAKKYLRGDGTTESSSQITALQAAGAGRHVYFPRGTYTFPDGVGWTAASNTVLRGPHSGTAILSVKNAYAFTVSGASSVRIEGFDISFRSGSTTGGAVKSSTGGNNSLWLEDISGDGVTTLTQPMYDLAGIVGAWVANCRAANAPIGFYLHPGGDFCNTNTLVRCRAAGATNANTVSTETGGSVNAGFVLDGSQQVTVRNSIAESNYNGYGVFIATAVGATIDDIWYESNAKDNIHIVDSSYCTVSNSKFQYFTGTDATANHIQLVRTNGAGHHDSHTLLGNHFQDATTSGIYVDIGTNVENTVTVGGDAYNDASVITDNGTGSVFVGHGEWNSFAVNVGSSSGAGYIRLGQSTNDPSAAPAGQVYLYSKVVAGKVKLYARFPTGGLQLIATEP